MTSENCLYVRAPTAWAVTIAVPVSTDPMATFLSLIIAANTANHAYGSTPANNPCPYSGCMGIIIPQNAATQNFNWGHSVTVANGWQHDKTVRWEYPIGKDILNHYIGSAAAGFNLNILVLIGQIAVN